MIFDPVYFLFIAPGFLLSLWASWKTKSAFKKYSAMRSARNITGAQAAAAMLRHAGISDVEIVPTRGYLSDHYNPMTKKLALSEPVYSQPSVAAIGVACHEAGHAIQHARGYSPLWVRSALVPMAGIGSNIGVWVMVIGLMLSSGQGSFGANMVLFGALLFGAVVLFQLVTLPVEFDASRRAKEHAFAQGLIVASEREGVAKVLNAAALTYVAAAVSSILTLLYFLMRAGFLGNRD
ncbi:MAG: zinc metallopeptidase [Acidobacteriota bacterium]